MTPRITGESVSVEMRKEAGVLGIRIAGGSDKPYGRGLIRVKQLTADTASSRSGILREGDIIRQVYTCPPTLLTPGVCYPCCVVG